MAAPPSLQSIYTTREDERAGGRRWRTVSRVLHEYYRRNFADARAEQKRLYPENYDKHVQRVVPFVYRVARELASLYLKAPARRFMRKKDDPTGRWAEGDQLPESVDRLIARVYRGAQVDLHLRHAQELMIATGNAPMVVFPNPLVGGVSIHVVPPHETDVKMRHSLATDELDVEAVWLRLPLSRDPLTDLTIYGVAEITPQTAVWVDGPPEVTGQGLWNDAGTNPIGEVPLVMVRASNPDAGSFYACAPEDLLDAQRAIDHDMTDLGTIARLQGFAQGYVKGMSQEQVNDLEIGPNTFAGLWGEDAELGFASPSPDLRGYQAQMESYMRTVTATNGLNPATLTKSQGVTALAKIIELADREVERRRHVVEFERAESRVYRLIAMWVNHLRGQDDLMPKARVVVEYREPYMPADPLHEAQSMQLRIALGVSSPIREIARLEGLTQAEAIARSQEIVEEKAMVAGGSGTTLNGAQILAALQVAERVSLGALSRDGAIAFLVEGLGMTEDSAREAVSGAAPLAVLAAPDEAA